MLVASFIGVFGLDLVNRIKPKVISEQQHPSNFTPIQVNQKKLTYAWRLEDEDGFFYNFTGKLFPQIHYYKYRRNHTTYKLK